MIQYIIFCILVVMTPFVVVTKYLQGSVYDLSHMSFSVFGHSIPYVATAGIIFIGIFFAWYWKRITLRKTVAVMIIVAMIGWAQWLQDLYGGMSIYDLQKNWHYVTYAAYILMFFRAFHVRGMTVPHAVLYSFLTGMSLSIFDEFFQLFLSDRIFDISDIAKDSWGAVMGLILIFFVTETYGKIDQGKHRILQKKLKDYTREPLSAFFVVGLLAFILITFSPLLTGHDYWHFLLLMTVSIYLILFTVLHLSQHRKVRFVTIGVVSVIIMLLVGSFLLNHSKNVMHNAPGLTIYRGIPIPYFDFLIYPNGMLRFADKKKHFNTQDRQFMLKQKPSIILIGNGSKGEGGYGFKMSESEPGFYFNKWTKKGTQFIILRNAEACKLFNRLVMEGKNVLFIVHNG